MYLYYISKHKTWAGSEVQVFGDVHNMLHDMDVLVDEF